MKHFYLLTALLCCTLISTAQTRYWIGPAGGGNWNNTANWSSTSPGGAPGATVPNGAGFDVVFDQPNSLVLVDIASLPLNSITVANNTTARLYTTAASDIYLNSNTAALTIGTGAALEDSSTTGGGSFIVHFADNAKGQVNGTWWFKGTGALCYVSFPGTTGLANKLDVNAGGTIKIVNTLSLVDCNIEDYLSFNAGATYWSDRIAGSTPKATWNATSTIMITGATSAITTINPPTSGVVGNVVVNCPTMSADITWGLPSTLVIGGNLQVINTNNRNLLLAINSGAAAKTYTVQGNLEIQPGANLILATNNDVAYTLQVNGNFNQTGGNFYLKGSGGTQTSPVTLKLAGNMIQTAGGFGSLHAATSTSVELFAVELNGTSNQNLSLSSTTIDNAANQVTLRLNNTSGATLLTPLAVGKLSWNSANKGVLTTTSTNYLTINNTSTADPLVVNAPSNAGYISGPVRRNTANNVAYSFPVGKAGVLRAAEVKPTTIAASTYEAEYFNTAYSDLTPVAPLSGVSNQEYWNISQTTGSTPATIRLSLAGAVPGAGAADAVVIAHHNGSAWEKVNGTKITPGNATSGTAESVALTSFSPFTFAYAPAATLPIFLLDFTARKEGDAAKLNWSITDNSTPDKFEVLRSVNGTDFATIGTVTGIERKLLYDFTDNTLPSGTVYYRLRMIDKNAKVELTKILAVMNGSKGVVVTSMMPTIVTGRARLTISSSEKSVLQLQVTDIYGRVVKRQAYTLTTGNQDVWMDLGILPNGTYQVTGHLSNGKKTNTFRFIRQ
jgi:hypothetical protein